MEAAMRVSLACIVGVIAISLSIPASAKDSGGNSQSGGTSSKSSMRKAGGDPQTSGKMYLDKKKTTGGAGAGKAHFNEFQIKKTTDKASPN
jgi:hypothetical protein